MQIKTSLHIHTKEDRSDGHVIKYNIYQLIDHAEKLDFKVLALTGHRRFIYKKEYGEYAKEKGILLIPGIELALKYGFKQNHVLVLNCDKNVEKVKNFSDLQAYKEQNPSTFVIAPHPTSSFIVSIGKKKLIKYIDLFDAIEHTWFYTRKINFNKKAEKISKNYNVPFVATSDVHNLRHFNTDYLVIDTDSLDPESIFNSIRNGNYINCTRPKNLFELLSINLIFVLKYVFKFPIKLMVLARVRNS